jgi:hypothetical protein
MIAASASLITYDAGHRYGASFFRHLNLVKTANRIARLAIKPGLTSARHERAKAKIRYRQPLPTVTGPVDVYPWEMTLAYAHDLELMPRPTLQSYQAGDPRLAGRNVAHLARSDGPGTLLFRVGTIDNRYPSMDDGPSWPHILAGYRLDNPKGPHLVLRRARTQRSFSIDGLASHDLRFGESLVVNSPPGTLVWLKAEFDRGVVGRLAGAAYRGPILYTRIELANGGERWYRVVPGMAEAGFLLSPLVANSRDFVSLMNGSWPHRLAAQQVTSIEFATEFGASWYWRQPIRVELGTLVIE